MTEIIGPSALATLGVILEYQKAGLAPSFQDIATKRGLATYAVAKDIEALRRVGLLAENRGMARALVPQCRFVPAESL